MKGLGNAEAGFCVTGPVEHWDSGSNKYVALELLYTGGGGGEEFGKPLVLYGVRPCVNQSLDGDLRNVWKIHSFHNVSKGKIKLSL
jgi:hypothetical protein